jgi:hypothetical protein
MSDLKSKLKKTLLYAILRFMWRSINRCKDYIENYLYYKKNETKPNGKTTKSIYLDVSDDRFQRRLYGLLYFLTLSGYSIAIRNRFSFLAGLSKYSKRILELPNVTLTSRKKVSVDILITDRKDNVGIRLLDQYYTPDNSEEAIKVPHTFHPNIISFQNEAYLTKIRESHTRDIKCLFFGNSDPDSYSSPNLNEVFGIFTRREILDFIEYEFKEDAQYGIKEDQQKSLVIQDRSNPIPQNLLLPTLVRCDFFLATPGVAIPACHNLIEAMSVGVIPIIEFPHLIFPPLTPGKNCIHFSSMEELSSIIHRIITDDFNREDISIMREHVITFYQDHLSGEAVVKKLEKSWGKLRRIYLNAEIYTTNKMLEKGERISAIT